MSIKYDKIKVKVCFFSRRIPLPIFTGMVKAAGHVQQT